MSALQKPAKARVYWACGLFCELSLLYIVASGRDAPTRPHLEGFAFSLIDRFGVFMLVHVPHQLPALSVMLADLGQPSAAQLGRALGVSARTVQRWIARGDVPRPAALALFWSTRWGRSVVECAAVNEADALRGLLAALRLERPRGVAPLGFYPVAYSRHAANDECGQQCAAQHNQRFTGDGFGLGE